MGLGSVSQCGMDLLCQARDAVTFFEVLIDNARADANNAPECIELMEMEAGKLRQHYSVSEQPLIGILVRRLHSFVAHLESPDKSHLDDLQTYVDVLRGILDEDIEPDTDQAEFSRSLPVLSPPEVEGFGPSAVEVVVAEPNRASAHFVERELAKCGCRVTVAYHAFEARTPLRSTRQRTSTLSCWISICRVRTELRYWES